MKERREFKTRLTNSLKKDEKNKINIIKVL